MNFTPVSDGNHTWTLKSKNRQIARLVMDYMEQVDEVVLLPNITPEEALNVLRLAFSHAVRYVVNRRSSNGILNMTHRGTLDREASARLLTEDNAPEAVGLDAERLTDLLRKIGIMVIVAKVNNLREVLEAIVADERVTVPVTFMLGLPSLLNEQKVTFNVESPTQFRVWHNVGKPGSGFDLYIVPAYHPDRDPNKRSINLINGETDALIGGRAVRYVMAPPEATNAERMHPLSGSWNKANHPFYAAGSQISIHASPTKALSAEAIEEMTSLLLAMLELENSYLSVSGGFRGTYTHPQNIANRRGIRTTSWEGEARGSEGFCVWAYQVLMQEGELDRAYIPSWFHREGWLRAYEDAGYTMPKSRA